jgi:hypothetical protein
MPVNVKPVVRDCDNTWAYSPLREVAGFRIRLAIVMHWQAVVSA